MQARAGPAFCGVSRALGPPCLTAIVSLGMLWFHNRWNLFRAGIVLFFTLGGLVMPMDSPPLPVGTILGLFFLFPLVVVPPLLALRLNWRYRRSGPPPLRQLQFFQSSALAFIGFGLTALLRSIVLRESIGVQFMPIGFGLAICLGILLFNRMQHERGRG